MKPQAFTNIIWSCLHYN